MEAEAQERKSLSQRLGGISNEAVMGKGCRFWEAVVFVGEASVDAEKSVHGRPCMQLRKLDIILQVTSTPLSDLEQNYEVQWCLPCSEGDEQGCTPNPDESSLNTDPEEHWTPQGTIFMSP